MKVLIADSSPEVADTLMDAIDEVPQVDFVSLARDAQATLESIRDDNPEVVIVDARIPGSQGTGFLQTIRQERPLATLVILTCLDYKEYRQRFDGAGASILADRSRESDLMTQLDTYGPQDCSVWLKFACGDFRLVDSTIDPGLDVLCAILEA